MTDRHPDEPLIRRPLLGIAAFYILGIVGALVRSAVAWQVLFWVAMAALLLSLAGNLLEHRVAGAKPAAPIVSVFSTLLLYIAIGSSGWLNAGLNLRVVSSRELAALMAKPREGVELIGVISDDPFARRAPGGTNLTWSFPLRVEIIRREPIWQTARGTVRVALPDRFPGMAPQYGARWHLSGVLIDNARFPQERPAREWMKNRYSFAAMPAESRCLTMNQGARIMTWCFHARRKAADYLARGIEHRPEIVGLVRSLLLGYRHELADKLRNDFVATGTYHIFAISGQHIAILALFMIAVLQTWRVCRLRWFFYVAPLLILFTLSTGLSSSAVRGCLMALVVFFAPLLHRQPDLPSAMALAAILVLAVAPFQLFDYGFLLSFGVVAGLIVLCPPLLKGVEARLKPDPWRLQPERPAVCFWRNAARFLALLLVSSLAAWLVSTPLVARWFNLVSPIALLANLVVIPLSTLVLLASCLSVLCGVVLPWLGEVFNFANVALVTLLIALTDGLARIPWGHFFVESPPAWAVLVWFGTLLAWRPGWCPRRLWLIGPVILIIALCVAVFVNWNRAYAEVIRVGDTPIWLIKAPRMAPVLVHAGARFYGRQTLQSLQRRGINRLAALVLPAADAQHAGGALELLEGLRVKEFWCASTNAHSRVFRQALAKARDKDVLLRVLADDEQGVWSGNLRWQYQALSNKFLVRLGPTVLTIPWGQDAPEAATVEYSVASGRAARWRIRCLEFGEAHDSETNGFVTIGLSPRQGARFYLDESACRVEPLGLR
ncbi:MAG: ComEC/Rec2 family competence protein [Lentisphaerae bacterium]|nr:ComEC/Rec2 family competence protein [Lentisphaerota bacterium]